MIQDNLQSIKNEIVFFMEKTFQFSFVYIGAIFAGIAGIKLDVMNALSDKLHTTPVLIITSGLLVLNLVYLVLASSCSFAILKRGYFILRYSDDNGEGVLVSWEKFARHTDKPFRSLNWNVDNYFVVVIYILVFALSIVTFIYGLLNHQGRGIAILIVLLVMHLLPIWSLIQTARLNTICRQHITNSIESKFRMNS